MATQRVFYITQGSLCVWPGGAGDATAMLEFADDETGLRAFDAYLASNAEQSSVMLIDVIEEEYALESIPNLGGPRPKSTH